MKAQLPTHYVITSIFFGLIIHLLRTYVYKSSKALIRPNQFKSIILVCLVLYQTYLIFHFKNAHLIFLIAQSIGFICIGIFISSIYTHRAKRQAP